jgi:hypothetical protein
MQEKAGSRAFRFQLRGERVVQLERHDPHALHEERFREGAAAGTDLDDRVPCGNAERVHDAVRQRRS